MSTIQFHLEGEEAKIKRLTRQLFSWSEALSFHEVKSNDLLLKAIEKLERTLKAVGVALITEEGV